MKTYIFWLCLLLLPQFSLSQRTVAVDERLQPLLNEFLMECDKYGIAYHEKLFQLKKIDITNSLPLEEENLVMGMVMRDKNGDIEKILVNWIAALDPEILKVVAFHEFAHHFLDYKHTCEDCNEIMAQDNSSYFDVVRDWDNQKAYLFTTSPVYLEKRTKTSNDLSIAAGK